MKELTTTSKVKDKVMLNYNAALQYKTPHKGPFLTMQCWINITVVLQYGAIKFKCNICCIKPYKSDTHVEDINLKNMYDNVNI